MAQSSSGYGRIFRIASENPGVRHAVADLDVAYFRAYLGDDSGCFLSVDKRKRCWISTFSKVNVDEVHTGSFELNNCFVGFWFRVGQFDELENLGPTHLRNLYRLHGDILNPLVR